MLSFRMPSSFSAFLFLVPISGEAISATNRLTSIRRFMALAVKVTPVGIDIYFVVDNPSSVVFIIFSCIPSAGALTDDSKVGTAAKARRAMGERDLDKPSKDF